MPEQEVAPEHQPPHLCAREESRCLLPDLAGSQGWIKNDRHGVMGLLRVPASAVKGSEDGKCGPEHPVSDACGEFYGQLTRQIMPGQSGDRQDTAWAQRSRQAGQDFWKRHVVQGTDGHDGVVPGVGQRLL